MKNSVIRIIFLISLISFVSCKKSGTTSPPSEPVIVFVTDATGSNTSLGSRFTVSVTLTSALPSAQGIKIESTVTDQTSNSNLTQSALTSVLVKSSYDIVNLPQQHLCNVSLKVSSVSTPSNSATQTFTVVYK
jgi:hypothetical protein